MWLNPRRIDLIALALLVALLSLGYTFGLKRELAAYRELKEKESLLENGGGGLESDLAGLSREISDIDRDVARLRGELPARGNLSEFLAQMDSLCRANRVRLALIKPEPPRRGGLFFRTPVTVTGEARFLDFYRLLYQAEQMPQALAVERLKLERPEGLERCRFEMAISLLSAGG